MARSATRARGGNADYWPGFVDALSALLLVIIFLLSVFMLAQFFLGQAIMGRDEALARMNAQIAELSEMLALETQGNQDLRQQLEHLEASLSQTARTLAEAQERAGTAEARLQNMGQSLEDEQEISVVAQNQAALLNQQIAAMRQQLAALQAALEASESRDEESQTVIVDLGKRLNAALAQKVQELSRYRSEFFGRLREVLSNRSGVEIVGDRFVFQSEILFNTGFAELNVSGRLELRKLAVALLDISRQIPQELNWVLRVDGHTDVQPINSPEFPSNWELSSARAISVVTFLQAEGVPGNRLVAAGFGQYQPLDPRKTFDAYTRNRRIELKLTER